MHLLAPLLCGIRGAENGYARLFRRGTATRAAWYSTFEGDGADSSGDDIELDENGAAELYVSETVDVVVLDVDGAELRRFTDGYGASSVEVRSSSFTGTKYDDASTGTGSNYPVTLANVLDLWYSVYGAIDWQLFAGASTPVTLGSLSGLVFNVKAYGAIGNGVTDDTAAVNSAVLAAQTAGGGIVFFPAGTYRVTTQIEVTPNVDLVGVGSTNSIISTDHASNSTLLFSGTASYAPNRVAGLRIAAAQSNSGSRVLFADTQNMVFERCYIGGSNSAGTVVAGSSPTALKVAFVDCTFAGSAKLVDTNVTSSSRKRFLRCLFQVTSASYTNTMVYENACDLIDCVFNAATATAGTIKMFEARSTTLDCSLRGCVFQNTGGATATAMTLGIFAAASYFEESASIFGSSVTAYSYTSVDGVANQLTAVVKLLTRETRTYFAAQGSSPFSIGSVVQQYGRIVINDTLGTMAVSFANNRPPHGAKTRVTIWNTSGGNADITFTDPLSGTVAAVTTVADDDAAVYDYEFHVFDATHYGYAGIAYNAGFSF